MDELRAIKYFIAVVETNSFTEAAKRFSVPPSSLSRRIADLEESLGATLLVRTTRMVRLTEVGQNYYHQVVEITRQLQQSNESVRTYNTEPMGTLHISSMVSFGESMVLPLLDEFTERYPKIVLDVSLSDELAVITRDDIDIAIRGGYAPNERIVAINLLSNQFFPVAAPSYLKKYGVPIDAMELKNHKGLYFRTPHGALPWLINNNGEWKNVAAPAIAISNNGAWLLQKTLEGQGIMMAPHWFVKPYIDRKELVLLSIKPMLQVAQQNDVHVYLLYQKQRYQIPKIKAAVDFLVSRIKQNS